MPFYWHGCNLNVPQIMQICEHVKCDLNCWAHAWNCAALQSLHTCLQEPWSINNVPGLSHDMNTSENIYSTRFFFVRSESEWVPEQLRKLSFNDFWGLHSLSRWILKPCIGFYYGNFFLYEKFCQKIFGHQHLRVKRNKIWHWALNEKYLNCCNLSRNPQWAKLQQSREKVCTYHLKERNEVKGKIETILKKIKYIDTERDRVPGRKQTKMEIREEKMEVIGQNIYFRVYMNSRE